MIQLAPNEQVLLVIRRHWFSFLGALVIFAFLFIGPLVALIVTPHYLPFAITGEVRAVIFFLLALYLMAVLTTMFLTWSIYYLDTWIITDQRLIDIDQRGLFRRGISEIPLERVQNVSIEIPGFIATVLHFGNLKIQTAGESDFTIVEVPDCYEAKELILQHSRRAGGEKL